MKSTKLTNEAIAKVVNESKSLYCEECCTTFTMQDNGVWVNKDQYNKDPASIQEAELIDNSFLMCTCGEPLATKITEQVVIGEFVALN